MIWLFDCTSLISLQLIPLPVYPVGHFPHFQEPSGKLVHWAPSKHGLERHPSVEMHISDWLNLETQTSTIWRVEWHYNSPIGQACLLQSWLAFASPTQSLPSYLGTGLLQRRLRFWTPPPQVAEQVSQGDHGPQPPLTMKKYTIKKIRFLNFLFFFKHYTRRSLTRTWWFLTPLGLPTFTLAIFAFHLRSWRVTETNASDNASTTGDRAGGPGWPVTPAAILFNCWKWKMQIVTFPLNCEEKL